MAATAIAHRLAAAGLAGVWIYQGVVPKLWKTDATEVAYWRRFGLGEGNARHAVHAAGAGEVAFGLATLAFARHRAVFAATLAIVPGLLAATAVTDRRQFTQAFNPGSLNVAVAALAAIGLATTEPQQKAPVG